jgi:hypothetical protein
MGWIAWAIAGVVLVIVFALGRTRWSRNLSKKRGLRDSQGGPTPRALWVAFGLAVVGVAAALVAHNWAYLGILGVAVLIGIGRYYNYRRTGAWR